MKNIASLTIIVLLLTACAVQPTPTQTPTTTLNATPTAVPSATPSPTPTISPAVMMLDVYLEGEQVDTSSLSPEEFAEFSKALADKRNEERGVQLVIFDSGNDNPAYIDQNLDMRPYDGNPDQSKTIEMFLPVAGLNNEGNLQIEQDGKVITIANSNNIDWNAVITSSSDTRINWPTGMWGDNLRWRTENSSNPLIIKPTILIDEDIHAFFVENNRMRDGYNFLIAEETDENGIPILFRTLLVFNDVSLKLMEEGSDNLYYNGSEDFTANLKEKNVYYIVFYSNINEVYEENLNGGSIDNYQGIVSNSNIVSFLKGELENKQDLAVVPAYDIIIHK